MVWLVRVATAACVFAIAAVACTGGDALGEGERGTNEFAVTVPDGWVTPDNGLEERFELLLDHPDDDTIARLGVLRVQGLNDARAYIMDTSEAGAALRGLDPEVIRNDEVEVEGALEARIVEFTYTAAVDDAPRIHTLQLVVRRSDDVGFDLRTETLAEDWDGFAADAQQAADSFRLRGR